MLVVHHIISIFLWKKILLHQLSKNDNKKYIGLYRDDGFTIFKNISGSKEKKKLKDIQKLFKNNHLNITIQCKLKIVNYLDVTFNLSNAKYRHFCKPNNETTYIHKESNHTLSILRQILVSIKLCLFKHPPNKKVFTESTQMYEEALEKSWHNDELTYQRSINNKYEEKKFYQKRPY